MDDGDFEAEKTEKYYEESMSAEFGCHLREF